MDGGRADRLVVRDESRLPAGSARLRLPLLLGTFALLVLVLLPGIGVTSRGSSRWIGFSQFRLQPSELMKLALVVFGADLIVRRQERGASHRTIIGPLLLVAGAGGLILLQPDMGTALVIGAIAIALLFASGVSMRPDRQGAAGARRLAVIVRAGRPLPAGPPARRSWTRPRTPRARATRSPSR